MSRFSRRTLEDPEERKFLEQIAQQVVEHRRLRSLSQVELADLCGTTQPGIARFESGTSAPKVDTLRRVAAALDCELVIEFHPRTKPKGGR
jgi:transcriptional regulator with XRE-family HTH domain